MTRSIWILLLLALVAAGCGSDDGDGDGDDAQRDASKTTATTTTTTHREEHPDDEPGDPTEVPDPVPKGELPPIQVTSPQPLAYVSRSFVLAGTAQVFEGALRWAILDARLKPMKQGRMTATCGAPCRGRFRSRITLDGVQVGSWELHVWAPAVADDDPDRVHDTMVPITVTAEPVRDTPPPGSEPPGG